MRKLPIDYCWIIVGVTSLVLLAGAGIRATPGVLILPLEQEFGWSRATISFAVSLNLLLYGLIAPFAVAIMERYGVRRCILVALLVLAGAIAATAFMEHVWQLIVVWGVLVGTGTGFLATVLAATVASRWFTTKRGLVIGIFSGAAATGQLIFLPAMASVNSAYGWRITLVCIVGVLCTLLPLVVIFFRDRPSDVGMLPYGETQPIEPISSRHENPFALAFLALRNASSNRNFWLISGTFFVCGASTNGLLGTHLIPACVDHGYSEITGAALLATMGMFNFFGTSLSGWLSDKFDNRSLLAIYYGVRGVSLLYLPFSFDDIYTMSIFAAFFGLGWFATVSPTVRILANTFGRERAPLVFGWVFVCHQLGGASAAAFAALIRVTYSDYFSAFVISGLLCFVAAIAVTFIEAGDSRPDTSTRKPVAHPEFRAGLGAKN
ncbi:MAG: MFS transporter [Magnetospirillum sp.]|nr:MFS transporter [Magnetospirillum sp.]